MFSRVVTRTLVNETMVRVSSDRDLNDDEVAMDMITFLREAAETLETANMAEVMAKSVCESVSKARAKKTKASTMAPPAQWIY